MSKLSTVMSRGRFLGAAVAMTALSLAAAITPAVSADQVANRSLTLTSSAPGGQNIGDPGSGTNGTKAGYTFTYTAPTNSTWQSWSVVFCDQAFSYADANGDPNSLTTPCKSGEQSSVDAHLAPAPTVTVNSTDYSSNWSLGTSAVNYAIKMTSDTAITVNQGDVITISFVPTASNYISNPTEGQATYPNNTFFAHMQMYSDDAYTTGTDDGTVVSATTLGVGITSRVQETLKFSVGIVPSDQSTSCAVLGTGTNSDNALTMGDVNGALSTSQAYDAYSFFRVSTNAVHGTAIQYSGKTLTSGGKYIAPIGGTATVSTPATEQFGLAIDEGENDTNLNTTTYPNWVNGTVVQGAANYNGADTASLATATFAFDATDGDPMTTPVTLASANDGDVIDCDTKAVRYVGNIGNNTPAGIYKTTINYIAVPKY